MAKGKKSMIGFDPLAWLDDESGGEQKPAEEKPVVETKPAAEQAKPRAKTKVKSRAKPKTKKINVLGHSIDEVALLKGFDLAADVLDEAIVEFYEELFVEYPDLQPLFASAGSISDQGNKLQASMRLLIENLHNQETMRIALHDLGKRHQQYGALEEYYPAVAKLLVASLKKRVGRSWTKAVSAAWETLLGVAAETMCEAYEEVSENPDVEEQVQQPEEIDYVEEVDVEAEVIEQAESNEVNEPNESVEMQEGQPVLQLSSIQDISKSQALKNDIMALVNDTDEISIDGSEVERIDGSALQLLCALFDYAKNNSLTLHWIEPSDALIQSAEILGVQQLLELER